MEWIISGIALLVILGAVFKPSCCDFCGTGFKRKYYTWRIEGKKQHLCPNCNRQIKDKHMVTPSSRKVIM